eukprot:2570470-Prymnesium_polylepis.1
MGTFTRDGARRVGDKDGGVDTLRTDLQAVQLSAAADHLVQREKAVTLSMRCEMYCACPSGTSH